MKNRNIWLAVGFLLTAAYFVAAAYFGETRDIVKAFGELPLNTQGDTLAGFFAPLAFLWLFIATMIQSQELAAQRKEIEDNRAVMQEQSDAAKDQARFLEAQTDAMKQQTQLLVEQVNIAQLSAERTHKVALFEKRIEIYNDVVNFARMDLGRGQFTPAHATTLQLLATRAEFVFGVDVVEWLENLHFKVDFIVIESARWQELAGYDEYGNFRTHAEPELNSIINEQIRLLHETLWSELREVMGKYLDLNEYRTAQLAVTEQGDTLHATGV